MDIMIFKSPEGLFLLYLCALTIYVILEPKQVKR